MKILLDSSAMIDLLKGDAGAIRKIGEHKSGATFYTSTLNVYEFMRGIRALKRNSEVHLKALYTLLGNINVLSFDVSASEKAAEIYAEAKAKGGDGDEAEYLVAGVCLANGIEAVITRQGARFREMKKLKILAY